MQLGARWRVGDPPHRGVPVELHEAIATQERLRPTAVAWTLTWLEGRPRCALDDTILVELTASGEVSVSSLLEPDAPSDDDDWLS